MGDSSLSVEDPNYYYDPALLPPALQIISKQYRIILKINLSDDTFFPIKYPMEDYAQQIQGSSNALSSWLKDLTENGQIFNENSEIHLQYSDINKLRNHFDSTKEPIVLRYRRTAKGSFPWVFLEIHPAQDYSQQNQTVYIFVHDINEFLQAEIEEQEALKVVSKTDLLTGLGNFYAYKILCNQFSHKQNKTPVGLVFADLNGLKIVNDTQGHEKGNEFIISFTKLFSAFFADFHCFRISGDEFIAVSENLNRNEFESKMQEFKAMLQGQLIPPAAIGWQFEQQPQFIEDLTRPAEMQMYQDKKQFYEKHPEYKRSIVEKSFQNEVNTIIKLLSANYKTLFVIDLQNDSFKILKQSYEADQEVYSSYSQHLQLFVKNNVDEKYQDLRLRIGSIDYLKKQLVHENTVSCDFMMKNGSWRTTSFYKLESMDGIPTKAILYSIDIDKGKSNRFRVENLSHSSINFADVICTDYTMICEVDTESGMMNLIHISSEFTDQIAQTINNQEFYTVKNWFINNFVVESEVEAFSQKCSLDVILEKLKASERFDLYCHTYGSLHNQEKKKINVSKFSFFYSIGNKGKILFATKNLTEELINLSVNL